MDSPTQALLGAVTAQLGFRQKLGRDATWVAAATAYSPDLDSFIAPISWSLGNTDPFTSILYHRWITHSLLLIPVIALLFALPWLGIRRIWERYKNKRGENVGRAPFWMMMLCCAVAAATHAPLDWCTSYGTQLLSPITNHRFAIDAIAIVDIIYTPILILTLLTCFIVRRGRKNIHKRATVVVGAVGLLLATGYICAGWVMHNRAVDEALESAGVSPDQAVTADAYPMIGTIFLWQGLIQTEEQWIIVRVHHLADGDEPRKVERIDKHPDNQWFEKARQTRAHRIYHWFSSDRLRYELTTTPDGQKVVELHDMRYAFYTDNGRSMWPVAVIFPKDGGEPVIERRRGHPGRNMRDFAATIWADIMNP